MHHNLKKGSLMSSSGPFCVKGTLERVCVCGGGGLRMAEEREDAAFHA